MDQVLHRTQGTLFGTYLLYYHFIGYTEFQKGELYDLVYTLLSMSLNLTMYQCAKPALVSLFI